MIQEWKCQEHPMSESNPSGQSKPSVVTTIAELRQWIRAARSAGKSIGLVPTMGALHEGHLSLVRGSQAACDLTIVTIFVNPTQFGPREDYGKYPRTLEADLDSLRTVGADLVFVPANDEMYPADMSTWLEPPNVGRASAVQGISAGWRRLCSSCSTSLRPISRSLDRRTTSKSR
jgi:pantoate--beta-alanine ligase